MTYRSMLQLFTKRSCASTALEVSKTMRRTMSTEKSSITMKDTIARILQTLFAFFAWKRVKFTFIPAPNLRPLPVEKYVNVINIKGFKNNSSFVRHLMAHKREDDNVTETTHKCPYHKLKNGESVFCGYGNVKKLSQNTFSKKSFKSLKMFVCRIKNISNFSKSHQKKTQTGARSSPKEKKGSWKRRKGDV